MTDSFFDLIEERNYKNVVVFEGRPTLGSLKSSCRNLLKRKKTPIVMADNMAGFLFCKNLVKEVWLACQLADDGGALCDIGALILGVLAKEHKIPVYGYPAKKQEKILGRQKDITCFNGVRVAPPGVKGYVPLMEWVPRKYIAKIYSTGEKTYGC